MVKDMAEKKKKKVSLTKGRKHSGSKQQNAKVAAKLSVFHGMSMTLGSFFKKGF